MFWLDLYWGTNFPQLISEYNQGRMSASPEAAKADAEDVEVAKADEAVDMRDAEDDKDNEPNGVDRSPSPRPRSASPARSVSRSPVDRSPVRERSISRGRARSDSREPRRRRSDSREVRRRYSRSRSRDRGDYRRRSPSPRDRYRRRSPSPRGYRGGGGRDSYRDSYRRRSPPAPYYNRPRRTPPRSGTTLFVAGLNFVTTEREVEAKFEKFGAVKEARIVRNPVNGESRGFGFVAMKYEEDVDVAIRTLDGAEWQGRRLGVERARNVNPRSGDR
ncbi:g2794 [Coccomyxa viridis]|uniref:G2794 protein n=1 Tax=Coccomyxa viridis TaxID=1274662 RepID=A0ABP1FMX1_9CHLO